MPAPLSSTICPRWGPGSSRRESNAYAGRGLKFGALSMESRDVADLRCRCFCGRCYGDPNDAAYDGTTTRPGRVGLVSHTESVSIDAPLDRFRDWANRTELQDLGLESENTPSVLHTEMLRGSWDPDQDRVGARRRTSRLAGLALVDEIPIHG